MYCKKTICEWHEGIFDGITDGCMHKQERGGVVSGEMKRSGICRLLHLQLTLKS